MSRTQNSILNMMASLGGTVLVLILNFITRSVFIRTLGASYLGIEGLFSNILTLLSLTELGFGSAIVYKLYKPIEEQDRNRILVLLKLYRQIYRCIGCIIVVLGICLIPLLPVLVKDYETFAELGLNATVIFLMYLFNSASSYWFFAYKSSFITANQKHYIELGLGYVLTIGTSVAQILALVLTGNFVAYLSMQILFTILQDLLSNLICNRLFPFVREKTTDSISRQERRQLFKDCYALMLNRINTVVIGATDNIILSAVLGLEAVGLYANYLALKTAIKNLLVTFTNGIQASLGSLFTTGNLVWMRSTFRAINFLSCWLFGVGAIGASILINDFLELWIGADFIVISWNVNGTTTQTPVSLLIGIEIYLLGQQAYCNTYRNAAGLFQQFKYRPVASVIVNLVVSILAVPHLGIAGCIIGTIASMLTTTLILDPIIIHRYSLKESVFPYFGRNLLYKLILIGSGILSWYVCGLIPLIGILGFLVRGCICVLIPSIVLFVCYCQTAEVKFLLTTIKGLLSRRKGSGTN